MGGNEAEVACAWSLAHSMRIEPTAWTCLHVHGTYRMQPTRRRRLHAYGAYHTNSGEEKELIAV